MADPPLQDRFFYILQDVQNYVTAEFEYVRRETWDNDDEGPGDWGRKSVSLDGDSTARRLYN